jgi:hypothetical protein
MTQTLKRLHALRLKAGHPNPTLNKINVGNGWNAFFRACSFQNILGWSMPADPQAPALHVFISRSAIPIAKLVRGPCSSNETQLLNKSFKYCFAYNYCEICNTNCLFSGLICLVFHLSCFNYSSQCRHSLIKYIRTGASCTKVG